jgi:Phage head-tail joining protein
MAYTPPTAADLKDRIQIVRNHPIPNGKGGQVDNWTTFLEVRGQIVPTKGGDGVRALRVAGTNPMDITIRNSPKAELITIKDRAIDLRTGQRVKIRWIGSLDPKHRFLLLACEGSVDA